MIREWKSKPVGGSSMYDCMCVCVTPETENTTSLCSPSPFLTDFTSYIKDFLPGLFHDRERERESERGHILVAVFGGVFW